MHEQGGCFTCLPVAGTAALGCAAASMMGPSYQTRRLRLRDECRADPGLRVSPADSAAQGASRIAYSASRVCVTQLIRGLPAAPAGATSSRGASTRRPPRSSPASTPPSPPPPPPMPPRTTARRMPATALDGRRPRCSCRVVGRPRAGHAPLLFRCGAGTCGWVCNGSCSLSPGQGGRPFKCLAGLAVQRHCNGTTGIRLMNIRVFLVCRYQPVIYTWGSR